MTRIALFFFALIASVLLAFASPVPVVNGELVNIEKRQTRTGRVSFLVHLSQTMTDNYLRIVGHLVQSWLVLLYVAFQS